MKSTKSFLILILHVILILHNVALATPNVEEENSNGADYEAHEEDDSFDHPLSSAGRSLRQKKDTWTVRLTCNKFPRICQFKGSPGPSCCKKKCVNVLSDRLNCGKCGKKCKYNETCCKGKCVNPSFNSRHCGGCGHSCNKGEFCFFGLCNYA